MVNVRPPVTFLRLHGDFVQEGVEASNGLGKGFYDRVNRPARNTGMRFADRVSEQLDVIEGTDQRYGILQELGALARVR